MLNGGWLEPRDRWMKLGGRRLLLMSPWSMVKDQRSMRAFLKVTVQAIDDDYYNGDNFSDEIEKDDLYDDVYDDPDLLSEDSINDDYMVIEGEN